MLQKKQLAAMKAVSKASSMSQSRVIPESEAESVPDENVKAPPVTNAEANAISNTGRRFSLEQVSVILRARRFFARNRSSLKHDSIQVNAFSLHGYSSMRMLQDGPQACKEKVNAIVTGSKMLKANINGMQF